MLNLAKLKGVTADDVLAHVGLQQRQSESSWIIPAVTMLGVGVLIGAGLGLMLAPRSGRELRGSIRKRLDGKGKQDNHQQRVEVT